MSKIFRMLLALVISFNLIFASVVTAAQQTSPYSITPAVDQSGELTGGVAGTTPSSVRSMSSASTTAGADAIMKANGLPALPQTATDKKSALDKALGSKKKGLNSYEESAEDASGTESKKGKLSEFELYVSGHTTDVVSTDLRQFGYDLFETPPSTFAPIEDVPVSPDYVIGAGDEIKVAVWGAIEGSWTVDVDRAGNINLPRIGTINVANLSFSDMKEKLHKQVLQYYKDVEMDISMGSLKTMRIYVVGNAKKPGVYTVSSLTTLVNALFASGGPSKNGSMRDFQLKRSGKTIAHFDMYDFLLNGDKSKDFKLLPDDVIFIPHIGSLVGIAGSVHVPAVYELKSETGMSQLIGMAGGLSTVAFIGRVNIERIVDNRQQVVFESDLESLRDHDIPIQTGDVLKIYQVVQDKQTVKLSGSVKRPGEFGFTNGMTVKDLVSMGGGLQYFAAQHGAELVRVTVTSKGPEIDRLSVNLKDAIAGDPKANIKLQENDFLLVRSVPEWEMYRTVEVTGEVKHPGEFATYKGETLSSVIERAGGFTTHAYLRGAVFTRERVKVMQQKGLDDMAQRLERQLLADSSQEASVAATPEDISSTKATMDAKKQFIQSLKEVKATGRMTIWLADLKYLKGTEYDIQLEDGDTLSIPTTNSVVGVAGAVMSPGSYIYSGKNDYKDYIGMSGGYVEYSDTSKIYVLKVDGSARKLTHGFLGWESGSNWLAPSFAGVTGEIEAGDVIIVPEKLTRSAFMRNLKDITQILMQIAVSTGVVLKLF